MYDENARIGEDQMSVILQEYETLKQRVVAYVQKAQVEKLPTIGRVAMLFGMGPESMLALIEDADALDYNIGIAIQGLGTHTYLRISDYTMEMTE